MMMRHGNLGNMHDVMLVCRSCNKGPNPNPNKGYALGCRLSQQCRLFVMLSQLFVKSSKKVVMGHLRNAQHDVHGK